MEGVQLPPLKQQELLRGFGKTNIILGSVFPVIMTLFAYLINYQLANALDDGLTGLGLVLVLALAHLPILLWTRQAILNRPGLPTRYWFLSTIQVLWVLFLAWYSVPMVAFVCYLFLFVVTFNDTRYLYDARPLRLHALLIWPVFDGCLLLIREFRRMGMLDEWFLTQEEIVSRVWVQVALGVLLQLVIHFSGQQARALDAEVFRVAELERQRALMNQERVLMSRVCGVLAHGLTASRFSHDVRSPLTSLQLSLAELRDVLAEKDIGNIHEILLDIENSARSVMEMTEAMSLSLRDGEKVVQVEVIRLVGDAVVRANQVVGRRRPMLPPILRLEMGSVWVTSGHAGALANILLNGARQAPENPIEITGNKTPQGNYCLEIRDWGVEGTARDMALERIKSSFSLEESPQSQEGYGISLMLARLLVVRYGGALSVRVPEGGAGLVMVCELPLQPVGLVRDSDRMTIETVSRLQ